VPFKSKFKDMVEFEDKIIVESSIVQELIDGKHDLGPGVKIGKSSCQFFELNQHWERNDRSNAKAS
jgi:hypothetical protein